MQIKISQKYFLISHELRTSFLILNSSYFVKIYPGLLSFQDLISKKEFKFFLNFQGPQKDFTVIQNLKNGEIKVFFHTLEGYFSYKLFCKNDSFIIHFEKLPLNGIDFKFKKLKKIFSKDEISLPIKRIDKNFPKEFLSFGIFKKQDLFLIKRRNILQEMLPFIFLISQFYLDLEPKYLRENSLIKQLDDKILKKEKKDLDQLFFKIIKAHFFGAFIPRINDWDYQNILEKIDEKNLNPLNILRNLFESISSLFLKEDKNILYILPCLLPTFHHGRIFNLKFSFGYIDIEWSKKFLKKAIIKTFKTVKVQLKLQSKLKSFRLKTNRREKGKFYKNNDEILFEKQKFYFLDKFQK